MKPKTYWCLIGENDEANILSFNWGESFVPLYETEKDALLYGTKVRKCKIVWVKG